MGCMSIVVSANEADNQNTITHSEAFWKLYTDALRGEKNAQFEVGVMYERGIGVDLNQFEAAKWYEKAANQGHKDAQYNMGIMYASGRGVEQNDQFAMMWLASSAKQGDKEARDLLLNLIDGKAKSTASSSNIESESIKSIKAIRFTTKEGASVCNAASENGSCTALKEKQTYTSKSKQGNYYKISGIVAGHKWQDYEGDGFIEISMVELK
jgi:hypothetical protein